MRFLNKKIYVTAPSDSITSYGDKLRFGKATEMFNKLGYDVEVGKTVHIENNYSKEEYELKSKELENAIKDNSVDIIISANGGDKLYEIIPYLNFGELKKLEPKIFQGFSDNSIITFLFNIVLGWKTIYAPCFPTFGYSKLDKTILENIEILKGNYIIQTSSELYETNSFKKVKGKELYGYNLDTINYIKELNNISNFQVSGELIGGCLDVLRKIIGTQYDDLTNFNKKSKKIWFIENCYMNLDELEECLVQMKDKNWFSSVSCFMIGRGKIGLNKEFKEKENKIFKDIFEEYNVPIIVNCDFGHVRPFHTIICGENASLEYKNNKYKLKYNK